MRKNSTIIERLVGFITFILFEQILTHKITRKIVTVCKQRCGKIMSLHLSVTLFTGGCTSPPRADTSLGRTPPPAPETATAADGTHPPGMPIVNRRCSLPPAMEVVGRKRFHSCPSVCLRGPLYTWPRPLDMFKLWHHCTGTPVQPTRCIHTCSL